MEYRVCLAVDQERDLTRAAALQEKVVAWSWQQAAAMLALPKDAALDDLQRNRIRTLGGSLGALGNILREQGSAGSIKDYQEAIECAQRIKDTGGEAIVHYNLGNAYLKLADIRDLDVAEAAYLRSLDLHRPHDALARSRCIKQIGMVHHQRLWEARAQDEPSETLFRHWSAARDHYQKALDLCPASAIADLGPIQNLLGLLYAEVAQTERAREHYEKAVRICQQTGDCYGAGKARFNMAVTYAQAAEREEAPAHQGALLLRGQA